MLLKRGHGSRKPEKNTRRKYLCLPILSPFHHHFVQQSQEKNFCSRFQSCDSISSTNTKYNVGVPRLDAATHLPETTMTGVEVILASIRAICCVKYISVWHYPSSSWHPTNQEDLKKKQLLGAKNDCCFIISLWCHQTPQW